MNSIDIDFFRFTRKKETASYPVDTETVDLSGLNIFEIDLSQIGELDNLRTLKLSQNRLERIDISDLSILKNIQYLDISNNKLLHLDLSLLRFNETLRELRLNRNLLKGLKLGSIDRCSDLEVLDVSYNHIHSINLSSLTDCTMLRQLNLSNNQLDALDPTPLTNADALESFDISKNWIREIDTQPLKNKFVLKVFNVNENPLSSIDLSFLSTSPNLHSLLMDWTQVQELDLSYLRFCKELVSLGISQNKITNLDLYPLMKCEAIESINISGIDSNSLDIWPLFGLPHLVDLNMAPRNSFGVLPFSSLLWSQGLESVRNRVTTTNLQDLMEDKGFEYVRELYSDLNQKLNPLARYHLRVSFIEYFNLNHLAGFDGDPLEIARHIGDDASYDEARYLLSEELSTALVQQVRNGGSTHFIDLDLVRSMPVLAVLAPKTIELRRAEIECVHVIKNNGVYDTEALWFTVYGQEILSALGIGLVTDDNGLLKIRYHLRKVGIDSLKVDEENCPDWTASHLSDELRSYLRFLAIRCCSKRD
ncbi:MAG: leucine-rich repeat domain-containing protein [Candidatus Thorarchaeota archaeon]